MAVIAGLEKAALTPTQWRILNALGDGYTHSSEELRGLLCDDMAVDSTLRVHLTKLRDVIRGRGFDVVFVKDHGYQLVMHINRN